VSDPSNDYLTIVQAAIAEVGGGQDGGGGAVVPHGNSLGGRGSGCAPSTDRQLVSIG